MNSSQFSFGTSLGGWPASTTAATTTNFGTLNATNNKPTATASFPSFGNVGGAPAPSSISFGATTTSASATAKPGNFQSILTKISIKKF